MTFVFRTALSALFCCLCQWVCNGQMTKPNIFFILVDDLGFGDVNFNRLVKDSEIVTPHLDNLVENGLLLHRHYVHYTCTPTRTSFQSGRLPVHVTTKLVNPDKPNAGIPRNMTGIASKMQLAGYQTHIVGKWDAGMATFDHTPRGRGYNTSLIYFEHKNDFWTNIQMQSGCINVYPDIVDLWANNSPAYGLNGTMYEEYLFAKHIYALIDDFATTAAANPFFMVYTPHVIHCPLQVPKEVLAEFNFDNDENVCKAQTAYVYPGFSNGTAYKCRSIYHAMVSVLNAVVGNATQMLKDNGLWENTLLVLSSDNGGPITLQESGANNTPLRGSKYSPFEGGIRAAAFVSGGYLPANRRGLNESGMMHVCDWYTTFTSMVGVDPFDARGAQYNLPPVEGYNMWPMISGINRTSPRTQIPVDGNTLLDTQYKYVYGNISFASWEGSQFPNASSQAQNVQYTHLDCKTHGACLFDILNDFTEHENIAASNAGIVTTMADTLTQLKKSYWSNNEQGMNSCPANVTVECACWMAKYYWNGFFGPYQYMSNVTEVVTRNLKQNQYGDGITLAEATRDVMIPYVETQKDNAYND